MIRYFHWAFVFTAVGLLLGGWLGWVYEGTWSGVVSFFFICCVLAVLEISLSFDNSIVNARILQDMTPKWQHRFLTWGIIIAVFGMRIVFPLAVVAFAAGIPPHSALVMAARDPQGYAQIISDAHIGIAAFGGTFLMMVGLKYFFDAEKDVHWIRVLEARAQRFASVQGVEIGITLVCILVFAGLAGEENALTFMTAALYGLLAFLAVEGIGALLDATQAQMDTVRRGGAGAFLYLEVLDASFSFDGVVGAFALSKNLFVIAIGLGIGAFYVRSMTIMLVEKKTLSQYRYLEHGAFYAVLMLAFIMYVQTIVPDIPEVVTGGIGVCFIIAALYSSIRYNRRQQSSSG
ncbi:MAG: Hypothetical protein BHV28_04180 [Candidatus Tokpelaia hoelldobleri]|uniref:DUF475 domain-containing protein n=1 Tax=Candidatus Tokpelaia hoelldobleri TaxID=1902579 RepID=A0A1U9JTE0_9HYPH|nr:MAG: Hypothetical protein BHV28_04180 [Candidatus Tokpelaia hoelldoblerii]